MKINKKNIKHNINSILKNLNKYIYKMNNSKTVKDYMKKIIPDTIKINTDMNAELSEYDYNCFFFTLPDGTKTKTIFLNVSIQNNKPRNFFIPLP